MTDLDQELAELGVPTDGSPAAPLPEPPKPALAVVDDSRPEAPWVAAWRRWKPEFAKAMDGSYHTVEALERQLFQGKANLWPGANAAVVTEIQDYPGERALQALWAAGDVAEVLALIPGIEAFGRLMGCTSVLVEGRKGWERTLKGAGFAPWSVTLRKAL